MNRVTLELHTLFTEFCKKEEEGLSVVMALFFLVIKFSLLHHPFLPGQNDKTT